jgi:hypothetical protein
MATAMKKKFSKSFSNGLDDIFDFFNNRITVLETTLKSHEATIHQLETKCTGLEEQYDELKIELTDFKKVSIIKSLNKQLMDKDSEILFLNSKIKQSVQKARAIAVANEKGVPIATEEINVEIGADDDEEAVVDDDEEAVVDDDEEAVVDDDEEAVVDDDEEAVVDNDEEAVVDDDEEAVVDDDKEANEDAVVDEDEDEEEEEVEVEFIEKTIKGVIYFVTDDEDRDIYEKLDNGALGECVGKYNNKNRAKFFKK